MAIIKKLFLSSLVVFSLTIPSACGVERNKTSNSKQLTTHSSQEFEIKDVYNFGDTFNVPTLILDGITYQSTVEFPNGSATRLKKITLNQVGKYIVHYSAYTNGKYYSKDYSFIVKNTIFSFSGDKSRAAFGTMEENYNIEGLYVSLADGETFTYNKVIDLRNVTKNDHIFKLFVCPSSIGTLDFQYLYVTFTDIEDPTSQMTLSAHQSNEGLNAPYTYWMAKGKNQEFAGIETGGHIHDPRGYKVHKNNAYGQATVHSFYGYYPSGAKIGSSSLSAAYSSTKKEVYVNDSLCAGFLNPELFDNLWDGFVSGKVIMSITAGSYLSDYASFNITQLMDFDLSNVNLDDNIAPEIDVELPEGGAAKARVGYYYPIYKATATDNLSTNVKLNKYVYFHRSSSVKEGTMVNYENDKFYVDKEGVYSIVYEAIDDVGNSATRTIKVTSTKDELPIYAFPSVEPEATIKQGHYYYFPEFIISGGSGGGFTKEFTVTKNGNEIENNNEYFIPKEVGNYRVKMTATDLIGQRENYYFNVEATSNDGAMFYDSPRLPKYFLSESEYQLPALYAVDYSDNAKEVLADVQIEYGSKVETLKSGTSFRPIADSHKQNVKLTYKYKDASLEFNVPIMRVYEGQLMNITNYFDLNNIDFDVNQLQSYALVTAQNNGDASWEFANPLLSDGLSLDFATIADGVKYSKLRFTLQDKYNQEQEVSVELSPRNDGLSTMSVIGENATFGLNFYEENEDETKFTLSYDNGKIYVNGAFVNLTKYNNGKDFEGFDSDFVYIKGEMISAKAGAKYKIIKFDNQTIRYWAADNNPPKMIVLGEKGGYKPYGSLYTMPIAKFGDVLDPNITSSVSVYDPEGNIVKDVNGLSLDAVNSEISYTFKLDKYGQYIVEYTAKDTSNKKFSDQYAVGVLKEYKPEIHITSSYVTDVSLGESIIVPNYEIKYDGNIDDVKTYVTVKSPTGTISSLPKKTNSYLPKYEGIYLVTIYALDVDGNIDIFKYEVNVHK